MISFLRRNRLKLCLASCFLLLLGIFWYAFSTPALEWVIKNEIHRRLGDHFQVKEFNWEKGALILQEVHLTSSKEPSPAGSYFSAEQILLDYDFSIWHLTLDLKLLIDKPFLKVNTTTEHLMKALLNSKPSKPKIYTINWVIEVQKGTLKQRDKQFFFALSMNSGSKNEGQFTVHFDDATEGEKHLTANFSSESSGARFIRMDFAQLPLPQLLDSLIPFESRLRELSISTGELDGFVQVTAVKKQPPAFKAELILTDVTASHADLDLKSNISKASLRFPFTDNRKMIQLHEQCYFSCGDFFRATDINGGAILNEDGALAMQLESTCHYGNELCRFGLKGKMAFNFLETTLDWHVGAYDLLFRLEKDGLPIQAKVDKTILGPQSFRYLFECLNFENQEIQLCKKGFVGHNELLDQITLTQGTVDAKVAVDFKDDKMGILEINSLNARDLAMDFIPWELSSFGPQVSGSLSMDFAQIDPAKSIKGAFFLDNGKITLGADKESAWEFEEVHADIKIDQGKLQKSEIQALFAGQPSKITLSSHLGDSASMIHFEGLGLHLAKLLPPLMEKGFQKEFAEAPLSMDAIVQRKSSGLNVDSAIVLGSSDSSDQHIINVEFDLVKALASTPHQLEIGDLSPANGVFSAAALPLDKFISPLLFENDQFQLSGHADFHGTFNESSLTANYETKNMILENDRLLMELTSQPSSQASGSHTFDFAQNSNQGWLKLAEGSYFDKSNQLPFYNINASMHISEDQIQFDQINCSCYDLHFSGAIDLDYRFKEPGRFNVDVTLNELAGNVSSAQKMAAHFPALKAFNETPLKGNLNLCKGINKLAFAFYPSDFTLHTQISGSLSEGALDCSARDFTLDELSFNFNYDNAAKMLDISALQALLFLGDADNAEEFLLTSNCHFTNLDKGKGRFDVLITSGTENLFVLNGTTAKKIGNDGASYLGITLDNQHSSLLHAVPSQAELTLDSQLHVDSFKIAFKGYLKTFLTNLRSLGKIVPWQTKRATMKTSETLDKLSGSLDITLSYDQRENQFLFNLKGDQLQISTAKIDNWLLNGKKQGNIWSIEQLQADKLSVATDIVKENQKLVFNFLGIRWGTSILAGLKGEYAPETKTFTGKVNLLETQLQDLKELPLFGDLVDRFHPKGTFKATGDLQLFQIAGSSRWKINTLLNGSIKSPQFFDIPFEDINEMALHYISDELLSIENFECCLKNPNSLALNTAEKKVGFGYLNLQKAHYLMPNEAFVIEDLKFQLPAKYLPKYAEVLREAIPEAVDSILLERVIACKRAGDLRGKLSLSNASGEQNFKLQLAKGKYWWLGTEHDIENFVFSKEAAKRTATMRYFVEMDSVWLQFQSLSATFSHGQLFVSDQRYQPDKIPTQIDSSSILTIDWTDTPHQGFAIQRAVGSVSGITINATKDPKRAVSDKVIPLVGTAAIQVERAFNLFPQALREWITEWEVGNGYTFSGQWVVNKENRDTKGLFSFQGTLNGQKIRLYGYQFDFLQSDCSYVGGKIRIENLNLQDPAGTLFINTLESTERMPGTWFVTMDRCAVTNLRPSLLRGNASGALTNNPNLLIKSIELLQLQGISGKAGSYTGTGLLYFDNRARKSTNPLFVIPSEIINRIGLDMSILTPVSGSINFIVGDGRIYLKKFKDVFSDRKLSKFNLVNSSLPSYVDFNGNLNLHVRMKHYNLLFKLSELFTFNIKGTLQHPTYTLDKSPRRK